MDTISTTVSGTYNFSGAMKNLLETSLYSDVTFIIGPSMERINAHKSILGSRSEPFSLMFCERWNPVLQQESPSNSTMEINLPEFNSDIFKMFLQCVYTDSIHNLMEHGIGIDVVLEITKITHIYQMQKLFDDCTTHLYSLINHENWFKIYKNMELMDIKLSSTAREFFLSNVSNIIMNKSINSSFLEWDSEIIEAMLKDDVQPISEINLFKALILWKNEDERRESDFQKLLKFIRFPTMGSAEFTDHVVPMKVLTNEQSELILRYINKASSGKVSQSRTGLLNKLLIKSSSSLSSDERSSLPFNAEPRKASKDLSNKSRKLEIVSNTEIIPWNLEIGGELFTLTTGWNPTRLKLLSFLIISNQPLTLVGFEFFALHGRYFGLKSKAQMEAEDLQHLNYVIKVTIDERCTPEKSNGTSLTYHEYYGSSKPPHAGVINFHSKNYHNKSMEGNFSPSIEIKPNRIYEVHQVDFSINESTSFPKLQSTVPELILGSVKDADVFGGGLKKIVFPMEKNTLGTVQIKFIAGWYSCIKSLLFLLHEKNFHSHKGTARTDIAECPIS